jgi:hypothetical protein
MIRSNKYVLSWITFFTSLGALLIIVWDIRGIDLPGELLALLIVLLVIAWSVSLVGVIHFSRAGWNAEGSDAEWTVAMANNPAAFFYWILKKH